MLRALGHVKGAALLAVQRLADAEDVQIDAAGHGFPRAEGGVLLHLVRSEHAAQREGEADHGGKQRQQRRERERRPDADITADASFRFHLRSQLSFSYACPYYTFSERKKQAPT